MRKTVRSGIGIIAVSLFLFSCTTYAVYSQNFLAGKDSVNAAGYDEAQTYSRDAAKDSNVDFYARERSEVC